MQQRNRVFDRSSLALGAASGAVLSLLICVAFAALQAPTAAAPATLAPPLATAPARECAARAVFYTATEDDWGQRALIAYTVLNRAPSPDAGIPCGFPSPPPAGVGDFSDAYFWLSAVDAVDAIASGSYDVPPACTGATEILPFSDSPRSQCVIGSLAFEGAR